MLIFFSKSCPREVRIKALATVLGVLCRTFSSPSVYCLPGGAAVLLAARASLSALVVPAVCYTLSSQASSRYRYRTGVNIGPADTKMRGGEGGGQGGAQGGTQKAQGGGA